MRTQCIGSGLLVKTVYTCITIEQDREKVLLFAYVLTKECPILTWLPQISPGLVKIICIIKRFCADF